MVPPWLWKPPFSWVYTGKIIKTSLETRRIYPMIQMSLYWIYWRIYSMQIGSNEQSNYRTHQSLNCFCRPTNELTSCSTVSVSPLFEAVSTTQLTVFVQSPHLLHFLFCRKPSKASLVLKQWNIHHMGVWLPQMLLLYDHFMSMFSIKNGHMLGRNPSDLKPFGTSTSGGVSPCSL